MVAAALPTPVKEDAIPHVMVCYPFDRSAWPQFVESLTRSQALTGSLVKITPIPIPGAIIHLSRDLMVKTALQEKSVTHLCMVDTDQTFAPLTIPRLVAWNVPVVAPLIVQRQGDPIPVAYRKTEPHEGGGYEPQFGPLMAYLSQFDTKWYFGKPAAVLPLKPDHDPVTPDIPEAIRAGLTHPLFPVDAVGTGMVVFRRDVLEALQPNEEGLYCDFVGGRGEDFSLCEKVWAAGWGTMAQPTKKGHGVYVDRGLIVGHLTTLARTAADMVEWLDRKSQEEAQMEAAEALLPPASDLASTLEAQAQAKRGELAWLNTILPARPTGAQTVAGAAL